MLAGLFYLYKSTQTINFGGCTAETLLTGDVVCFTSERDYSYDVHWTSIIKFEHSLIINLILHRITNRYNVANLYRVHYHINFNKKRVQLRKYYMNVSNAYANKWKLSIFKIIDICNSFYSNNTIGLNIFISEMFTYTTHTKVQQ